MERRNVAPQGAFGDMLREFRAAANITQEELAERSGVSVAAIAALEQGVRRSPRPSTVDWLAEALKLEAREKEALVWAARRKPKAEMIADRAAESVQDVATRTVHVETAPPSPAVDPDDTAGSLRDTSTVRRPTMRIERLGALTILLATIVTFPVDLFWGRPSSAVAALIVIIAAVGLFLARLWYARLPSGQPRYNWQRRTALMVALGILASLATAGADPGARDVAVYGILGFPRSVSNQLTVAAGNGYYRIQTSIKNPRDQDDRIASVTMDIDWVDGVGCSSNPSAPIYQLQDDVLVGDDEKNLRAMVTALFGPLANLSLQATGSLTTSCAGGALQFTFQPGLVIAARSTELMYVDIPQRFTVHDSQGMNHVFDIPDPVSSGRDLADSSVFIRSVATMTSGSRYSSCGAVDGIHANSARPDGC